MVLAEIILCILQCNWIDNPDNNVYSLTNFAPLVNTFKMVLIWVIKSQKVLLSSHVLAQMFGLMFWKLKNQTQSENFNQIALWI